MVPSWRAMLTEPSKSFATLSVIFPTLSVIPAQAGIQTSFKHLQW